MRSYRMIRFVHTIVTCRYIHTIGEVYSVPGLLKTLYVYVIGSEKTTLMAHGCIVE